MALSGKEDIEKYIIQHVNEIYGEWISKKDKE